MKKCFPMIFATLLTIGALTGCAAQKGGNQQNSSSEQNNIDEQNNTDEQSNTNEQNNTDEQNDESAIHQTTALTNATPSPTLPPNVSAAYEKLIAYKTGDYAQQSIADFNMTLAPTPDELTAFLAAEADVISAISSDDENYDFFTTTISFSAHELYCEHMGEEFTFFLSLSKKSRPCSYLDEDGETVYDFTCFISSNVAYSINAPKLVTVAERDYILLTFKDEMQNYLNGLSEAEITGGNIRALLAGKAAELINRLSTENMQLLSCEFYLIEINDAGTVDIS